MRSAAPTACWSWRCSRSPAPAPPRGPAVQRHHHVREAERLTAVRHTLTREVRFDPLNQGDTDHARHAHSGRAHAGAREAATGGYSPPMYEALAAGERPRSEAAHSARTRHQELVQLPQKPDERLGPGGQRRREYNRRLGIREPQIERRRDSINPDKKSGVRCPGVMTVLIGRSIMATWIASCSTRPTCWSSDGPTWRRESECHA